MVTQTDIASVYKRTERCFGRRVFRTIPREHIIVNSLYALRIISKEGILKKRQLVAVRFAAK